LCIIEVFKKPKPLKNPEDFNHAYEYALFLLNLRGRTEGEMCEKMLTRGYVPGVVEQVIQQLYEDRYLDDERYAEMFIDSLKRYKYYGRFIMKKKLFEKKLPKEIVEAKLTELVSEADEREIATRYVEREFGALVEARKLSYEDKQKIMRRLLSRGFGIDLAKELLS
jgi:regulatory protein